jgi:hypothetical protein
MYNRQMQGGCFTNERDLEVSDLTKFSISDMFGTFSVDGWLLRAANRCADEYVR